MNIKKAALVIISLAILLYGSYRLISYYKNHQESELVRRINTYWSAIASHDLLTAYQLEAEAINGTLRPDEVKLGRDWGIRLIGFTVGEITYNGDQAEIMITRESTLPDSQMGKTMTAAGKDLWTFTHGAWYHGTTNKGGSGLKRK